MVEIEAMPAAGMLERIKDVGLLELPLRKMSNVDLLKLRLSSKAMAKGEIGAEIERILARRLRGEIVAEPGRRVSLVRWLVPDRLLAVAVAGSSGGGRSTVEFWRVGSGSGAAGAAAEAAGNLGMEFGSPVRDILYRGGYLAVVEQNGPVRLWRMAAAGAGAGAAAPEYIGEVVDIEQPRDGVVAAAWFLGDRRIGIQIDADFCVFGFGGRGSGSGSRPFRLLGELSGEFNTTFHPLSDTAIIENEGPELLALPGSSSGSGGRSGGTLRIWEIIGRGVEFRRRTTFKLPANYGRSFEVVSGGGGGILATSEHFISEPGEDKIVLWDGSSSGGTLRRIRELSPGIPAAAYASDATKSRIGPMRFAGTHFAAAAAGGIHIWPASNVGGPASESRGPADIRGGPADIRGGPASGFPVQYWTTTQKSGSRPRRTRRNYVDFAWGKKVLATAHSHGIDLWNLPELLGEPRGASSR